MKEECLSKLVLFGEASLWRVLAEYLERFHAERNHQGKDSTLYTSVNMFCTMEQILGLPPLNQLDKEAQLMVKAFTSTPDFTPFTAVPNQIPLNEMNPALMALRGLQKQLALASLTMDFSESDKAPADLLNRVIWHSVKGYDALSHGSKGRSGFVCAIVHMETKFYKGK